MNDITIHSVEHVYKLTVVTMQQLTVLQL